MALSVGRIGRRFREALSITPVLAGTASVALSAAVWIAPPPATPRQPVKAAVRTAAKAERPLTPTLAPGRRHQRTLASGQTHTYQLQLAANDFLRAVVTPRGIDVAATLVDPTGHDLLTVDLSTDPDSAEPIVLVAPVSGRYQIKVKPIGDGVPAGRYTIAIEDQHPAVALDATEVAAMRSLEIAARGNRTRNAASLRESEEQSAAAEAGFRETHDRLGEARALVERAKSSYYRSAPDSRDRARDAVALCRTVGDPSRLADALFMLAITEIRGGDIPAGIAAATQALALAEPTANAQREANARVLLGITYDQTGDAERAIEQFKRALPLTRLTHNQRLEISTLNNLGLASLHLGAHEESLKYNLETLAVARASGQERLAATVLSNMNSLYRTLGEPEKGLASAQEALQIAHKIGDADLESTALNQLGYSYLGLGEFQKALEHHQQSLALRERVPFLSSEAAARDGMGQAWSRLGNLDKAAEAFTEALRVRKTIGDLYDESETLLHLARTEQERGHLDAALAQIEEAVALTESLRGRVVSKDLRVSFAASEHERYGVYIDILMQLHAAQPGGDFASRALEASERGRARVLLESLLEGRTEIRQGIEPALLASERAFQKQLDDASSRVSQMMSGPAEAKALAAARGAVETLSADYRELEARIRRESPAYAALTQPHPLTAREIQRDIVDPDTLFLEFALGESHSWLWIVGPSSIETIQLPPREQIETSARRVYALLTSRQIRKGETSPAYSKRVAGADAEWQQVSASFSQMLLGQAATRLGEAWHGKRLLIAPDAALEYVPFAVLPDPASLVAASESSAPASPSASADLSGVVPLVDGHEIVNVPSASVLAEIRQQTDGRAPAVKTVAVLADPVFDAGDPRVTARAGGGAAGAARSRGVRNNGTRGTSIDADVSRLPLLLPLARLPFSRREAQAIAALVPAGDRLEAIDFQANRALVTEGSLDGYRFVHFATHGFFNSARPEMSGLVLSLVRPNGQAQDGFLRLSDIYNMRLPAELVVLSACQTALGKDIRGEGLIGLTRGFMYAGARRIVASLWQVDDVATAELMRVFYRGMLKDGLRPAAALRAAQRNLATHPQWKSPYYWSPFVLQGEWK
jgi:CHAT domain-containing protein/tetratricopeptide (TPR) repeat protein